MRAVEGHPALLWLLGAVIVLDAYQPRPVKPVDFVMKTITVHMSSSTRFACPLPREQLILEELPMDTLEWYYNERWVVTKYSGPYAAPMYAEDANSRLKLRAGWLLLADVTKSDAGNYSCLHRDDRLLSSGGINYQLQVLDKHPGEKIDMLDYKDEHYLVVHDKAMGPLKPYFVYAKDDIVSSVVGRGVRLECVARGNPPPVVSWYRGDSTAPLLSRDVDSDGSMDVIITRYAIHFVAVSKAVQGTYRCIAENTLGFESHTFKLLIKEDPRMQPPHIKPTFPHNTTVIVGHEAKFECPLSSGLVTQSAFVRLVYGKPVLLSRWFRSDDVSGDLELIYLYNNSQYSSSRPGQLKIANAAHLDAGAYMCKVYNDIGSDVSTAYLTVVERSEAQLTITGNGNVELMSVSIVLLVIGAGLTLLLRHKCLEERKLKRKVVEQAATLYAVTKRVLVEHQECGSVNAVVAPTVRIERIRISSTSTGLSEYELPLDPTWEIERERLQLGDVLGEGAFGRVTFGLLSEPQSNTVPTNIAVKMLKEGHTDVELIDLVSEMEVMKMIGSHENIISLIGTCTQTTPIFVVVEYAPYGNLRSYLQSHQTTSEYQNTRDSNFLSIQDLVGFSCQIAVGMEYLSSRKLVHRDLAARNVLVGEVQTMKIADFGMARDINETMYYRKLTDGKVPVKWMSPEALFEQVYTTQSDVWSFGVLLWEIMSMGGAPYPSVVNVERLFALLREGYRMECPPGCPLEVYQLMTDCWQYQADDRPSFQQLVTSTACLRDTIDPNQYVDMSTLKTKKPPERACFSNPTYKSCEFK